MNAHLPPDHPPVKPRKIGVLLLNLGTPDGTDYWSVRRYLKEFLSDPRVIETPKWLWWPILNFGILSFRPQKTGANYAKIWDKRTNESPLRVITRGQAEKLQQAMAADGVAVEYGMRYGNPSTESAIKKLHEQGCDKILLFPLYPQYSATTTATANDQAFRALANIRWQPAVRTVPAYFEDDIYVETLANSIREGVEKLDFEPDLVITSYHGMPKTYLDKGDPYHCQCHKTTRLVREKLGWPKEKIMLTFQSRFGPTEWLRPYTDETLKELPGKGIKKVAILAPAFSADCIETLEEIAIGGEEEFMHAGGERYAYIPCLNDTPDGMAMIESVVRRELSGWL
ncbi:ferrochelatase [Pelagibacterium halotolerans]|uniref:Ferrochelatase n=1 Tax=Pelagibacterium halotolerans (strain DSM 22347 / JCM 15775 / CGMCC 1.7692 / B2) TaxID=1082931 RepID=G4RCA4_PELHB|nr:ferrochelatase [Pelagibacterium halotolerans]AEQ52727.1 ferrochelatase, protoheme ferro-lyase [Pelagibacterium halotolerans B2]QJR17570.1 ferrochelatase [Pelagibacterium halotolerans]SEA85090.1 ferrochelatase [Pelagibacterium halotolerans]